MEFLGNKYKFAFIFLMMFLLVGMVSAAEFDNIKQYSNDDRTVTITNAFGLGSDIATIELITPMINHVFAGKDRRVMVWEVENYEPLYKDALKEMHILNLEKNELEAKPFHYEIAIYEDVRVDEYKETCISGGMNVNGSMNPDDCSRSVSGFHLENKLVRWERLNTLDLPMGITRIALVTDVEQGDKYDGIPTIFGEKLTRWAVWTEGMNINLMNYYDFNELSGKIEDKVTSIWNLTATGTVGRVEGLLGNAIAISGDLADTWASTTLDLGGIQGVNNWTISLWANLTYQTAPTNHKVMFMLGNPLDSTQGFTAIFNGGDGEWAGGGITIDNSLASNESMKHHVLTYNGSRFDWYINGTLLGSVNKTFNLNPSAIFTVGKDTINNRYFNGTIDELGIWNRSLSSSEISDLYNNGIGITYNPTADNMLSFLNISYSPTVQKSEVTTINTNVTFNNTDFSIIATTLTYNNTNFSVSTTDAGLNRVYSTDITTPNVKVSTVINFFWTVATTNVTGTTYYQSTTNQQTVNSINASFIGFPYTPPFINFSIFDQNNLTPIDAEFDIGFNFGFSVLDTPFGYLEDTNLINSYAFSFDDSSREYNMSGSIEISKDGYTPNSYVIDRQQFSSTVTDISLYLLNSTDSTSFIIEVKDSSFDPVAQAIVHVQRFYPNLNEWRTIEIVETNVNGKTIGHFVTEDVNYRFLIFKNQAHLITTTSTKIFCEETPCTITIRLPASSTSGFDNYIISGITSDLVYSNESNVFTYTYADSNESAQGGRLIVKRVDIGIGSDVIVCDESNTGTSAVITCDVSTEINGTYISTGYNNRSSDENKVVERIVISKVRNIVTSIGADGLIWSVFLLIGMVMLWLIKPPIAIISTIFAVIGIRLLGLISLPMTSLVVIIAVGIILLWEMRR